MVIRDCPPSEAVPPVNRHSYRIPLAISLIVFCAALQGILSRPVNSLASFWPANAILMGLLVRRPRWSTPGSWIGAFVGYMAADLLTGGDLFISSWLTLANMAAAGTGVFLYARVSPKVRRLRSRDSVLCLLLISLMVSLNAALVGSWVAKFLFNRSWATSFEYWFVSDLVNTLLITPVILTCPAPAVLFRNLISWLRSLPRNHQQSYPLLCVIVITLATLLIGGPGSIAFPVPALLWCALTYSVSTSAIINMFTLEVMMVATSLGVLNLSASSADHLEMIMSVRLGLALLSIGPLTAACINRSRNEVLSNLNHAVDHDFLTNILARRAFLARARQIFEHSSRHTGHHPAVLMLDIDHFKSVNDRFGHQVGDDVLVHFSEIVSHSLRQGDLFGRLGGEEFGIVLPNIDHTTAAHVAERLRAQVENSPLPLQNGHLLQITVSIGLSAAQGKTAPELREMISSADQALYRAKKCGRNRVNITITDTQSHQSREFVQAPPTIEDMQLGVTVSTKETPRAESPYVAMTHPV